MQFDCLRFKARWQTTFLMLRYRVWNLDGVA